MKKIILGFAICFKTLLFSQDTSSFIADEFNKELISFINVTKPDSSKNSFKYFVYVASFYSDTISKNSNCFTLGYILNSGEVSFISPDYVYYFNNEIVIVRIDYLIYKELIKELGFRKIDTEEGNKIIHKLFSSEDGGFTYRSKGLTYCKTNGDIEKNFYNNSDEIPFDRSIYKSFPTGGVIRRIDK